MTRIISNEAYSLTLRPKESTIIAYGEHCNFSKAKILEVYVTKMISKAKSLKL